MDAFGIKQLVASGKTAEAIDALVELSNSSGDKDIQNSVFLLMSKFTKLKKDVRNNVISSENADRELSQITINVLTLVDELEEIKPIGEPAEKDEKVDSDHILTLEQVKEMEISEISERLQTLLNKRKLFQNEFDIASDAAMKFNLSEHIKQLTESIEVLKTKLSEL